MLLEQASEVLELLRGAVPYYVVVVLPLLILMSPASFDVHAAHEFSVFRMQHYDIQGTPSGCRSSVVSMEARTLDGGPLLGRRCVLTILTQLTPSKFRELVGQGAGAVLVMVPTNMTSLSLDDKQLVMELENALLSEDPMIPVYFTYETPELQAIYDSIQQSGSGDQTSSATDAFLGAFVATGFQMVVNAGQAKPIADPQVINIQGKLSGYGVEEQLPTITLVAHYDAFNVAPALAFGADSNGSGVAALLELARLFSHLYSSSRTHARFNLLFLLSGAGKFNYQGTKKWIEDNLDNSDGSLLQDSAYTLCLDSIASSRNLYLHVSKPPKDGSLGGLLLQDLRGLAPKFAPNLKFDMIHKKINLAEATLAWEHERFSIRRLPAFTLSRFAKPRDLSRHTMLDTRDQLDVTGLSQNVKLIAEVLARHIYNLSGHPDLEIFTDSMAVQEDHLSAWLDQLTDQPRAAQLLSETNMHPLLTTLEQGLSSYLKEVKLTVVRADKRDPEFMFYDVLITTMTAYSVKPAAFDLVLMAAIALYLFLVFLTIQSFPSLYSRFARWSPTPKLKAA